MHKAMRNVEITTLYRLFFEICSVAHFSKIRAKQKLFEDPNLGHPLPPQYDPCIRLCIVVT